MNTNDIVMITIAVMFLILTMMNLWAIRELEHVQVELQELKRMLIKIVRLKNEQIDGDRHKKWINVHNS